MDEGTKRLAAEVNAVQVSADELLYASDEIHRLPAKDRDWEGRMICLTRIYSNDVPRKSMAVGTRLEALAEIVQAGVLPSWLLPSDADGAVNIAEPVFIAAACEPLIFTERKAYFEQKRFLDAVLRYATPEGRA